MMSFAQRLARRLKRLSGAVASLEELRQQAADGQQLERAASSGEFQVILDQVLLPLQEEARQALVKADPTDFSLVAQLQKTVQVVDEIQRRIEKKVQAGRDAANYVLQEQELHPLKEGE